jgi:hypothetical protein
MYAESLSAARTPLAAHITMQILWLKTLIAQIFLFEALISITFATQDMSQCWGSTVESFIQKKIYRRAFRLSIIRNCEFPQTHLSELVKNYQVMVSVCEKMWQTGQ